MRQGAGHEENQIHGASSEVLAAHAAVHNMFNRGRHLGQLRTIGVSGHVPLGLGKNQRGNRV